MAPVDVADQHHRHVRRAGETHVGDVPGAQIGLGRTARAFDDHQVRFGLKTTETVQHHVQQGGLAVLIALGLPDAIDLTAHDQLGAGVALRLQQDRVHIDRRGRTAGQSLQRLRPADLAGATLRIGRNDGGVVGHVLRLERPHPQAAIGEDAAQTGDQHRLAHVRAAALDHQRGHAKPPPISSISNRAQARP